jgi:hypothetical protein
MLPVLVGGIGPVQRRATGREAILCYREHLVAGTQTPTGPPGPYQRKYEVVSLSLREYSCFRFRLVLRGLNVPGGNMLYKRTRPLVWVASRQCETETAWDEWEEGTVK